MPPEIEKPHLEYRHSEHQSIVHRRIRKALLRLVEYAVKNQGGRPNTTRILDVGCGRGELLKDLASMGYLAQGVDGDATCVSMSSEYAPVKQGDIENLDRLVEPGSVDIVIASHVLEHTKRPLDAIAGFKRISRKWLILAVPNPVRPAVILRHFRRLNYSNPTHTVAWDHSHFYFFLTEHAKLQVIKWDPDQVQIQGAKLRSLLNRLHLQVAAEALEEKILPRYLPFFSSSINVLCNK